MINIYFGLRFQLWVSIGDSFCFVSAASAESESACSVHAKCILNDSTVFHIAYKQRRVTSFSPHTQVRQAVLSAINSDSDCHHDWRCLSEDSKAFLVSTGDSLSEVCYGTVKRLSRQ